ncbi:hypothetical protein BDV93DRAFT_529678 [Ceratobasidium sp. AG-I]|nr:hypothetical protein BDV93DRAFT_529678 [Ceratobasidium sp. AG-I]
MSSTARESSAFFERQNPDLEHDLKLCAEGSAQPPAGHLIIRAIHCWSFWHDNTPVDIRRLTTFAKLQTYELRGQVASMNGPYRFPVMAGELYIPKLEFLWARIKGMRRFYTYKGKYYREGEVAVFCVDTTNYSYFLLHPEPFYKRRYNKLCSDYKLPIRFTEIHWKDARPIWWRHLQLWLVFKKWARVQDDIPKRQGTKENKSGDKPRDDDSVDSSESGSDDESEDEDEDEDEGGTGNSGVKKDGAGGRDQGGIVSEDVEEGADAKEGGDGEEGTDGEIGIDGGESAGAAEDASGEQSVGGEDDQGEKDGNVPEREDGAPDSQPSAVLNSNTAGDSPNNPLKRKAETLDEGSARKTTAPAPPVLEPAQTTVHPHELWINPPLPSSSPVVLPPIGSLGLPRPSGLHQAGRTAPNPTPAFLFSSSPAHSPTQSQPNISMLGEYIPDELIHPDVPDELIHPDLRDDSIGSMDSALARMEEMCKRLEPVVPEYPLDYLWRDLQMSVDPDHQFGPSNPDDIAPSQ